ncbi:hypothetical protein QQS21_012327 [Conoideocrella luteorostrata]|uniref:Peptidase A1 domain-containing protein n=1 Tax=Conoideocrella luteorostrata TaxID=1105319 RepID=A0AAJ0FSJ4_9HYPO|nr:hypothetical protein QQS21_012327 [Conoideocrella luteorostrata]
MLSALLSLAALPLVAQAIELPMDNRMVQEPGLLRFPITVNPGAPSKNHILRRQQDVGVHAEKSGFFYSIELEIGTPPQRVSVNFDTGSAELWINPVCSKSADVQFCNKLGRFNGSQTFVDTNITNRLNYGTGYAQLEYGYDYVQIGSARISQQMFGVATDSEFAVTGILGAGPQLKGWSSDYPLVLDNMVAQKFIKSRAFSLDIRSIESSRGSVVFGGIDTKKFSGHLEKRPIIPATESPDKLTRYWVYLDGVSLTKGDGSKATIFDKANGQAVLLDSGYTVSALPTEHFNKIKDAFPGVTAPPAGDNSGLYRVSCNVGDEKGTVNFKFGKTEVNVPYKDFIWKQSDTGICVLGVTPDDKFPVLGDTFLRAAYVVYDQDNRNIHIANNEDCGSALVPIGSGPNAVPSIEGDCGKPKTTTTSVLTSSSTTPAANTSHAIPTGNNSTVTSTSSGGDHTTTNGAGKNTTTWKHEPTSSSFGGSTSTIDGGNGTTTKPATTEDPSITSKSFPTTGWQNTTAPPTYTSTFTTTKVHTVTSCPAYVTGCPIGSVTTETVIGTTTWCPGNTGNTPKPPKPTTPLTAEPINPTTVSIPPQPTTTLTAEPINPTTISIPSQPPAVTSEASITSVFTTTKTITISTCSSGQGPCHKGKVTTEVLTSTTYLCPESTATFTVPRTHTCGTGEKGCKPGDKVTSTYTVTVQPHTTADKPTPAPGCGETCVLPPPVQTLPPQTTAVVTQPKITSPASVPTASVPTASVPLPAPTTIGTITGITTMTKPGETPCSTCGPQTTLTPPPVATAGAADSFRISAMAGAMMLGALAVLVL